MSIKYSQSFKDKLVKQVVTRGDGVSIQSIARSEGVGLTTLRRWVKIAQEAQVLNPSLPEKAVEKRPEDWTPSERLEAIIACGHLTTEELSAYCRMAGIYPHHIEKWKEAMVEKTSDKTHQQVIKRLNAENKAFKKELNRKDKALAETAALLALKKKVQDLWGNDEDNT